MRFRRWCWLTIVPLVMLLGACGGGSKKDSASSTSTGTSTGSAVGKTQDNGEADKSPQQIVADAAAALREARSVHLAGKQTLDSKKTTIQADIEQPAKVKVSFDQNGATASIIAATGSVYIKANEAFWRQQHAAKAGKVLADRWFKAPGTTSDFRDLTKGLDFRTLSRCLTREHGTIAGGGKATVDGQPAVVVVDKGDKPGAAPGKLYVATRGKPYPLKALTTGNQRPGGPKDPDCNDPKTPSRAGDEITFSKWDEPVGIAPPAGAVDFNQNSASS